MSGGGLELYPEVFPRTGVPRFIVEGGPRWFDPSRIALSDTTLRDGQQGWRPLSVEEAVRLYELLAELGGSAVATAEFFLYTGRDREIVRRVRELGYGPKPIGWIRARREELRLVREAGLEETTLLTSISDYHIYYKFGVTRDKAIEKYLSVVEEAMKMGIVVRCTLEDATRASLEKNILPFVRGLVKLSEEYGVSFRVKVADTLGLGLPFPWVPPPRGVPALIEALRAEGLEAEQIVFHGHNDLGLVVANHLAAWLHGAGLSDCTLLGIGERAGNCPLEVMLVHYVGLTGREDRVNLKALPRVVEALEEMGLRVPEYQPLVGRNAFRTKAGIHIDGLLKNPSVYLPFDPAIVGRSPEVAVTAYGGRAAVVAWLRTRLPRGAEVAKDDPRVEALYRDVVRVFEETGRYTPLSDEEMLELASRYFPELRATGQAETRTSEDMVVRITPP